MPFLSDIDWPETCASTLHSNSHILIWLTKKVNGKCVRRRKFSQIEEPGDGAGSRGWNSLHGARFSKRS